MDALTEIQPASQIEDEDVYDLIVDCQSFIAEIAHELGRDPKDMLLEIIGPARIVDATAGVMDRVIRAVRARR